MAVATPRSAALLALAPEPRPAGAFSFPGKMRRLPGTALWALADAGHNQIALLDEDGEVVRRIGSLRLVGLASSVACLLCILQFVLLRPLDAALVAPTVLWLSVLNAVACTVTPVLLVMMAIERIGAGLTAQTGMIGPLSTIAMGVVILGEPFNAWIIAGTVLVMGGVVLVTRGR